MVRQYAIVVGAWAVPATTFLVLVVVGLLGTRSHLLSNRSRSGDDDFYADWSHRHRNLRISSFFSDPKSVALKLPPPLPPHHEDAVASNDDSFSFVNRPSEVLVPPAFDANDPQGVKHPHFRGLCDSVLLFLPDPFGGHGLGSQLNNYLIAVLAATYLDRALVLTGTGQFVGCPEDMADADDPAAANAFPKSLERLIEHPQWLSRSCPMPCQQSLHQHKPHEDWMQVLRDNGSTPGRAAPEIQCMTFDRNGRHGRETNVMVIDGSTNMQSFHGHLREGMIDRSTEEAVTHARDWAVRLGADADESQIFASLRDEGDIWDYVEALLARSGALKFRPWVARDAARLVRDAEARGLPFATGNYDGVHVRRGDKLARESKMFVNEYWSHHPDETPTNYIPFRQYLAQFDNNDGTGENGGGCGLRVVYVATDDPAEVHSEIANLPKDSQGFSYLPGGNDCRKFAFAFGEEMGGYHNLSYKRRGCAELYHCIVVGIADLIVLARSETFVGEYNSNWGRFIRVFRLSVNGITNVAEGGEPPVLERDVRVAWGNAHAKHIMSTDWGVVEAPPPPMATATIAAPPQQNLGTFFIEVSGFTEGISGWRITLNQVLRVVEVIPGASLVEPCMINGRLLACGSEYPAELEGSPVPVSEVFDMTWALQSGDDGQPPTMALYGEYLRHTQQQEADAGKEVKHFPICLKASQQECPEPYILRWQYPHILDSAINDDEISVYTVYTCWWGRCALELDRHFLLRNGYPRPEDPLWLSSASVATPGTQLELHPRNVQTVKDVLAGAGISERYSLLHWRAERPNLDYIKCAETLVTARHNLLANNLDSDVSHPFLLMTSVNEDSNQQWNGAILGDIASNGTPKEALDILANDGFVRFDQLMRDANVPVQDPGMLGVYDLILATMAQYFATCTNAPGGQGGGKGKGVPPGCTEEQRRICNECNYIGKFARLATDMRLEKTPGLEELTLGCWPV